MICMGQFNCKQKEARGDPQRLGIVVERRDAKLQEHQDMGREANAGNPTESVAHESEFENSGIVVRSPHG